MAIADTISSMYENVGEVYDTITNIDVNNGKNLLDYSTCKIGDLNTGTGAEETSTVRIISDFIEVTPNENYICTLIGGDYTTYYYSSNKAFISGGSSWIGSGNSFTTPNNAGYLRLKFKNANNTTISLNDLSNIMLNKGSTALPYQPYTDNPTYKNIENIPKVIRNSYLEIMNNGTDKIWNNWEKVEGTGESLSLNSTEEAPMKIELKGNTSQETTTGKNLLNAPGKPIEMTYTGNYRMLALASDLNLSLASGSYTMSLDIKSANGGRINKLILVDNNNNSYVWTLYKTIPTTYQYNSHTYTFENDVVIKRVDAQNAEGAETFTFNNIMLEQGSTATSYEPYTNGASPNPDYPQDIHVVSGDNEIVVCGKNFLETQYLPVPSSSTSDSYIVKNAYLPQGTYTLSTTNNTKFGNTIYMKLFKEDKQVVKESGHLDTSGINYSTSSYNYFVASANNSTSIQFTIDDNYYARIGLLNSDNTKEVMLVKGTEIVRTYEPYSSNTYNIDLPEGIELCKIGDYQDYIYKDNKKWYKYGVIGKHVFTGTEEDISLQSINSYGIANFFVPISNFISTPLKCSHLMEQNTSISTTQNEGMLGTVNGPYIRLNSSRASNVADFKTWLGANDPSVYYRLRTPEATEITDATLLDQLEAFYNAKSKNSQTNISQENNDLPFILDVTALKQLTQ